MESRDMVVTWPKTRPLSSYLSECNRARQRGELINYHIGKRNSVPREFQLDRLYRVHDGMVRGFTKIVSIERRARGEVASVGGRVAAWPAGFYIVCSPVFIHARYPVPITGFRGWRWFNDRSLTEVGP